jgi:hypothetical protein
MKNSVLALDYLSISVEFKKLWFDSDQETHTFNKCVLTLTNRKTSNFKKIYDLSINGLNFAEVRTQTNKSTLKVGHAIIKFKNELLYCGQLYSIYKLMKRDLSFNFIKINQIDIALDQEVKSEKDQHHLKFALDYMHGKVDFIGNQNIRIDSKHHKIRNIYIGQRISGKFMRCYYKKQELLVSNKTYINDFWKLNNIVDPYEVFRSELSLSGSIMNKIYIVDLSDPGESVYLPFLQESTLSIIQSHDFLYSVFFRETKDFCKTVKTSELKQKKRTNLCHQTYIFERINKTQPIYLLERIKDNASKVIHKIKMTAKFLSQIAKETQCTLYEKLSDEICSFENLLQWKENRFARWIGEHEKKLENQIYKRYMSNFSNLDINFSLLLPGDQLSLINKI